MVQIVLLFSDTEDLHLSDSSRCDLITHIERALPAIYIQISLQWFHQTFGTSSTTKANGFSLEPFEEYRYLDYLG